jgi:pyruvate/2-oxoglutarate/acetoin dehydrogenase E1 component
MGAVLTYLGELRAAMAKLAADERALFVGQAVAWPGQRAHETFADVPAEKRIELPVVEDFQIGFCAGLALEGFIPVSFFPRWDFLLLAANQLVNHLDKMPHMGWKPKVIIRVAVGGARPLNPGPQHTQNHTAAFRSMLSMPVLDVSNETVARQYDAAMRIDGSVILVEHMELYGT